MQDDATSRARAVLEEHLPHLVSDDVRRDADLLLVALTAAGLSIIDTRTHVAVPREPSEADVERVAKAMMTRVPGGLEPQNVDLIVALEWDERGKPVRHGPWWFHYTSAARAAIAALTQEGA